jgi:hypothetical protein
MVTAVALQWKGLNAAHDGPYEFGVAFSVVARWAAA